MKMKAILWIVLTSISFATSSESQQLCSIEFQGTDSMSNFKVEELDTNTFHIQLTNENTVPPVDSDRNKLGDFRHKIRKSEATLPVAIFECITPTYTKFEINSVEAVPKVRITRKRLVSNEYDPLTPSSGTRHFLSLNVRLSASATGQYLFYSGSPSLSNSTFFIFAQTDSTLLLGTTGGKLKGISLAGNKTKIPCVSPNPNNAIHLWRFNPDYEAFENVPVDTELVAFDPKQGFLLRQDSALREMESHHYRCTVERNWYTPPFVDIDVVQTSHLQQHPDLTINLLRRDGAECYGIPGSNVKLYKINATMEEAPEVVKCFHQSKNDCGERPIEVGSPVHSDASGRATASVIHFPDKSGLLICTSESEKISTWFFQGLDGNYYSEQDLDEVGQDALLKVSLVPNPELEPLISGSVLTVTLEAVSGVFVESPRVLVLQFQNGSTSETLGWSNDAQTSKSFLVNSNMVGVYVDDQLVNSGKIVRVFQPFQVFQRQCEPNQFLCDSGECISTEKVCDHRVHCRDGKSDEIRCQNYSRICTQDEFQCENGQCISKFLQCSGASECFDGSDERKDECQKCSSTDQYRCNDGQCIKSIQVCDAYFDCDDGSDEKYELCKDCDGDPNRFRCGKGSACIPTLRVCDGSAHCPDGSDEVIGACSDEVVPVITNTETTYEFPKDFNSYLVCEVGIPERYAGQLRFQPKVNWTYTALTPSAQRRFRSRTTLRSTRNSQNEIGSTSSNLVQFYFAYKLEKFSNTAEGIYKCTAFNEKGSVSMDLVAQLPTNECSSTTLPLTSPRPGHQSKPVVTAENFQCKKPGKFPDPEDCTVFHNCVLNGRSHNSIQHFQFNCPPGTVFCPKEQLCGWERDCPCETYGKF